VVSPPSRYFSRVSRPSAFADRANAQAPAIYARERRSSPASRASAAGAAIPPGDPLDETFINLDGPSMVIQWRQPAVRRRGS
jgi:hypothetical protein